MLVVSRGALLVATASMATGLLAGPGVAYAADTSTPLSAAEMAAELKAVSTASARAAADGWTTTVKLTGDDLSGSEFSAVDPAAGVAFERHEFNGWTSAQYVVAGKGTYDALVDAASRAAVKMMHRPSVRYVFNADKSVKLDTVVDGLSPANFLADGVDQAGTKTVHDDGSADYRLSEDDATMTVHVTAAGLLASADDQSDGDRASFAFTYGPHQVVLPSAAETIGSAALVRGLAYVGMADTVKRVAGEAATDALRSAHGRQITLQSLRKATQRDAEEFNGAAGVRMIKVKTVRGGVRVYAKNPWTHRTVSYTLAPSGRKVTIAKN